MNMHRHALDEGLGEERARQRDPTDQKRKGQHLRGDDAGKTEDGNLDQAGRNRNHRVGRDHGRAFQPGRHQQRQQDHARARGAADHDAIADGARAKPDIADPDRAATQQPAERHAQDQHAADQERGAGIGQPRIASAPRPRQRSARAGRRRSENRQPCGSDW